MKYLTNWLDQHANNEHYLFTPQDLRALCPDLSDTAFKTLLSRTVLAGYLVRVCRGIYTYRRAISPSGTLLFHAVGLLRANEFNYISLETALSDAGVISQIPMNWISIMSSGRSNIVSCGEFGTIEFVHTNQRPDQVMDHLSYDANRGLWRANVSLALRDMKATRRNCDLIDWDIESKRSPKITISPLRETDIPIMVNAFAEHHWDKPITTFKVYLNEQAQGKRLIWVAYDRNQFAGYVTLKWQSLYQSFCGQHIPEIMDLNVIPPFRKQGVASQLLDIAESEAKLKADRVGLGVGLYADYGAAQILYFKRGYIPDGQGITYNYQRVEPGSNILLDDDLVLWFTKKLNRDI